MKKFEKCCQWKWKSAINMLLALKEQPLKCSTSRCNRGEGAQECNRHFCLAAVVGGARGGGGSFP